MSNIRKFIEKILLKESFYEDGFEYQFIKVTADSENLGYNILVNVVLPKKGQSYATPVFSGHIHNFLNNMWKFIGSSFSYSEKILVDGEEPVNNGLFISLEKQRAVISTIRKEVQEITLKTAIGLLTFDVNWKPTEIYLEETYISFSYHIEIKNFILDSHYVVPDLKNADEVAGAIQNVMYDTDYLREQIIDVIYDVMSNEIDITSVDDLYYQVQFFITNINGFETRGGWGDHFDLEPEMFT